MPNIDLVRLGQIVCKARIERRLTQEQLAEAAGITKKYVSGIENGKNNLSYNVLYKLVSVLQIPAKSLFYPSDDDGKEDEDKLALYYRNCPEKDRELLIRMTSHLVDELNREP